MNSKKSILLLFVAASSLAASAQSLRLSQGEVTVVHSSANTGDMVFGSNSVTIEGKQYSLDNGTTLEVTKDGIDDNTVNIAYNGTAAKVTVAGNIARYLTINASAANVCILASADLQQHVAYNLSGTSANGSFYMDGKYAATFNLNNLSLTNADSAAINIQDGKHITIVMNGNNSLADGTGKLNNACLYVNGHTTFKGTGSLTVLGNTKHGITGDEHMVIEGGTINITSLGDGLHVSEYFKQTGGNLTIKSTSDGIDVGFKGVNKGTKDTYAQNGFAFFEGGTINITSTGDAAKGIKADSTIVVSGANLTANTIGNAIFDTTDNDISSSAALKTGGQLTVTSGSLSLTSTGAGGKGINADGDITIEGGEVYVTTTGSVWTYGNDDTKPHGTKTDANIYLKGGKIFVAASANSGAAFKTDFVFSISGGTIMGIGGKGSKPTANTQTYNTYSGVKVKAGQALTYNGVSFTIPSIYNNSSAKVLVSGGK